MKDFDPEIEKREPINFEEQMSPKNLAFQKKRYEKHVNDHKDEPCLCGHGTVGQCHEDCWY
jgi:hypothetical protein